MELQIQRNSWSCLPTAFAMVFGIDIEEMIRRVGHDGSAIAEKWANEPHPFNLIGFHIQEMLYVADALGYSVTPFEAVATAISNDPTLVRRLQFQHRLIEVLHTNQGVLTGRTVGGQRHAVAWDGTEIYDPGQLGCTKSNFSIQTFWRVKQWG